MRVPAQGHGYARSTPQGVTLPKDAVRWEANRVYSEWLQAQRQKRRDWSTARVAARARGGGEETPSEPESPGKEGEVTPPPHSPPLSYLILQAKPSTQRMCAQDHLFHT
jgi:hypothetical protein